METGIFGFLAETSIHPGTGQDAGIIDLPVAREVATGYPVVVGSALKGALRDAIYWRQNGQSADNLADKLFGSPEQAGPILVSDLRLLLLPVRSLTSSYYWITCPHLLERCIRDERRAGKEAPEFSFAELQEYGFLGAETIPETIHLEERQFVRGGGLPSGLVEFIQKYVPHTLTAARLPAQLVVLSDDDFAWFARFGLSVTARNVLNRDTKSSDNLWYEETIPPDSLFYCLLAGRQKDVLETLSTCLLDNPYVQVGGNETVGQGWFAIVNSQQGAQQGAQQ